MQKRAIYKLATVASAILIAILLPVKQAAAQSSGGSTMVFSPYTMYGLGDLIPAGTASVMSMGGAGIGMRTPYEINYLNPASLSAVPQRSALFSFGARGNNVYSETEYTKTAHNNFDISDIGFAVPLSRGIGMSFSLLPVSAVGFKSEAISEDPIITENIGRARYGYLGEGGISQVNMGIGVQIVTGFSVGADVKYYFGNIERYVTADIVPLLGQTTKYSSYMSKDQLHVSRILLNFGAQYSLRVGAKSIMTFGATYQPKNKMSVDREILNTSTNSFSIDTLPSSGTTKYPITVPGKFGVGVFYSGNKFTAGLDFSTQNWEGAFEPKAGDNITLRAQNDIRFGVSFCPDRNNFKSALMRWTYKAGAHYTQSYLVKDGYNLNDVGITVGADIPLRRYTPSKISLGLDFGKRGSVQTGQVREKYLKIFAGITLFAGNEWFYKQKFN